MKKIIFLLMMLFSTVVFTEKLTTDGKNHIDKLVGNWSNSPDDIITIKRNGNQWILGSYVGDCEGIPRCNNGMTWDSIQNYRNNIFVVKNYYQIASKKDKNLYFAYDTKYKRLVELDSQLNIIGIMNRK